MDEFGNFLDKRVGARKKHEATYVYITEVTHVDVSQKQITSMSTSLIPFVEHDDATRAEMGANMMRQAVPLVKPDAPMVGTGMERFLGEKSGYTIVAPEDGKVIGVDANHISILYKSGEKVTHELRTFGRSNANLWVHQKSRFSNGDAFKAGDVLVDGQATDNGELAVGQNLRVAYMPWEGFNFEDAIIISSRLVQDDIFTNISIDEYTLDVRDTKLGPESTTSDIPNVSSVKLKDLDEDGIIRVGAFVK